MTTLPKENFAEAFATVDAIRAQINLGCGSREVDMVVTGTRRR